MDYDNAVRALVQASEAANIPISLTQSAPDTTFVKDVFGQALFDAIAASGYPGGVEIPWSAEEFYLYALDEIEARQAGYRHDARTDQPSDSWDQTRYVIGDWAANPVSIGADRTIAYSRHGEGVWSYARVAGDLATFLALLAAWLEYFVVVRGSSLFDENFDIDEETRSEIRDIIVKIDPENGDAMLHFLLGEI